MRIALLEDDPEQAALIARWLDDADHACTHFDAGEAFLKAILRESFDLLMVDWLVPGMSGIEVLKRFRASPRDYTPVLFVTARDSEKDVVEALEAGADDYMAKPVRRRELLARIAALGRRARGGLAESDLPDLAPYRIDPSGNAVAFEGENVSLTQREFDLALFMFRNAGRVVSRSHILEAIWGVQHRDLNTRTVDTHMSRLRKKLKLGENTGWQLTAVYQHGYRLERLREVSDTG